MTTEKILQNYKFSILNHCLEINEYKKQNKIVPIEDYENLLEMHLQLIDSYIDSEIHDTKFKKEIGDVLGVKF